MMPSTKCLQAVALLLIGHFPHLALGQTGCVSSFSQLAIAEAMVQNTANTRVYIVCPFVNYTIGTLGFYNKFEEDGQPMIPIRPNMIIRCGYTGRRDGRCVVNGGDLFVDGTHYHDVLDDSVDGVIIEGFTFVGAGKFVAEFTKPGKVTFRDCIFQVRQTFSGFADRIAP
jgi:hypothetical protein